MSLQLYRVVGPARARELIYTARVLKGPEAADLGLVKYPCSVVTRSLWETFQVNHCVEQNADGDAAYQRSLQVFSLCAQQQQTSFYSPHQLAREILPNGPVGVAMAKVAINKGSEVMDITCLLTTHLE